MRRPAPRHRPAGARSGTAFLLLLCAAALPCTTGAMGAPWRVDHPAVVTAEAAVAEELRLHGRLDRDPDDIRALLALREIVVLRPLSRESEPARQTRAVLPAGFPEYETANYLVFSDADPQWTRRQAARLEHTLHQFGRLESRLDIPLRPLRHKLVCVLFARRSDYSDFARRHDAVESPWIAGYYAPASDRIVFYHEEESPGIVEARQRLALMRRDVNEIGIRAREVARHDRDEGDALRAHHRACVAHLERETQRIDEFARTVAVSTTVHEATHQLAFHMFLQSPRIQYPFWVSEGLATSFETRVSERAFGPEHDHEPRRTRFVELLHAGRLIPLAEFIPLLDVERTALATEDGVDILYHQAYALFSWLYRQRAGALGTYLRALRREPPGPVAPARTMALFESAFGPLDRLERSWLRWEGHRAGPPPAAEAAAGGALRAPVSSGRR